MQSFVIVYMYLIVTLYTLKIIYLLFCVCDVLFFSCCIQYFLFRFGFEQCHYDMSPCDFTLLKSNGFPLEYKAIVFSPTWKISSYYLCRYFLHNSYVYCSIFFNFIYLLLERGREGEKHQCAVASHVAPLASWPTTQACALTGNGTSNPWIRSPCSIHWATPARATVLISIKVTSLWSL